MATQTKVFVMLHFDKKPVTGLGLMVLAEQVIVSRGGRFFADGRLTEDGMALAFRQVSSCYPQENVCIVPSIDGEQYFAPLRSYSEAVIVNDSWGQPLYSFGSDGLLVKAAIEGLARDITAAYDG